MDGEMFGLFDKFEIGDCALTSQGTVTATCSNLFIEKLRIGDCALTT